MRPSCEEFSCTEYGFKFETPEGGSVTLCDEHAAERGLSCGGKSCPDRDPPKTFSEIDRAHDAKLLLTPEELVKHVLAEQMSSPPPPPAHPPASIEPPKPKGPTMHERKNRPGRRVKRHDTNEIFNSIAHAAASIGGSDGGLTIALQQGRNFKRVKFSFVDEDSPDVAPAPPQASPPPITTPETLPPPLVVMPKTPPPTVTAAEEKVLVERAMVTANAESAAVARVVEPRAPVTITSVFAALSSMAAGMKGLRLTNVEISVGELTVKVEQLELMGS